MTEPNTAAGRALLESIHHVERRYAGLKDLGARDRIRAIESEARASLDEEALRTALERLVEVGAPPDAMMDSTPSGRDLRKWWFRLAPVLAEARRLAIPPSASPALERFLDELDP